MQQNTQPTEKRALKERMRDQKENFSLVVKTYTDMVGVFLAQTAPVMSQATSAITVGYATAHGLHNLLNTPNYIAIPVGIVAAWALEGTGFTAVDERDRAEAHNRRTTDPAKRLDTTKSQTYVNNTFWVTIAIVLAAEVIPALFGAYRGEVSGQEVWFRASLLVWPFLARLGAQLLAFRSVRETVDTTSDDIEIRDFERSLLMGEMQARHDAKIAKILAPSAPKPATRSVQRLDRKLEQGGDNEPATGEEPNDPVADPIVEPIAEPILDDFAIQKMMIPIYQRDPKISDEKMGIALGISKRKVQLLRDDLKAKHVIKIDILSKGKSVTVNGQLPAFLAGELN